MVPRTARYIDETEQNFGWLTDHVTSVWDFLVLGIGTLLLSIALLYFWFRRRGYFGEPDGGF